MPRGSFRNTPPVSHPPVPSPAPVAPTTSGVGRPPTGSVSQRITGPRLVDPRGTVPARPISTPIQYNQYAPGQVIQTTALIDDTDDATPVYAEPEPKKGIPVWIWIALVAVLGGGAAWIFLRQASYQ